MRLKPAYFSTRFRYDVSSNKAVREASMEILIDSGWNGLLRETIRVGKRVQSRSATGNGMSVRLCRSEDFPAD